jgi:hypothetical protein
MSKSSKSPKRNESLQQNGGEMPQGRPLSGMDEIGEYVRRSPVTVLDWIRNMGFPASKIGGIWESDTFLIDKWRRKQITERVKQNNTKSMANSA